jgi:hypothetical protein
MTFKMLSTHGGIRETGYVYEYGYFTDGDGEDHPDGLICIEFSGNLNDDGTGCGTETDWTLTYMSRNGGQGVCGSCPAFLHTGMFDLIHRPSGYFSWGCHWTKNIGYFDFPDMSYIEFTTGCATIWSGGGDGGCWGHDPFGACDPMPASDCPDQIINDHG